MIINEKEKEVLDGFLTKMDENEDYIPNEEEIEVLDKFGLLEEDEDEERIILDLDNIQNFQLNINEYKKGLKDASYYVGFINALKSVGYPTALIHDLILGTSLKKETNSDLL